MQGKDFFSNIHSIFISNLFLKYHIIVGDYLRLTARHLNVFTIQENTQEQYTTAHNKKYFVTFAQVINQ